MENIEIVFIIGLYTIILNFVFSKIEFLRDRKEISNHKTFINLSSRPPFSGGIIFLLTIIIFFSRNNFDYSLLFILFFFVGFLSDTNILKSPNFRFILQIFFLIFFIITLNIFIESIRLEFFDSLLKNIYFKVFFSTFCILILVNGTNFIDGLNTLVIGYYILVLLFVGVVLRDFSYNFFDTNEFVILLSVLIFLLILNFFEYLYLGDGGAYLISVFFGIYLINIYSDNNTISPYYIMNLLWYPAYENLFSIIRKITFKYSAFKPDNLHLHQIIYSRLKDKLNNKKYLNTFTGIIINLFNLSIFYFATTDYTNTKFQLIITLSALIVYNTLYFLLKKKL